MTFFKLGLLLGAAAVLACAPLPDPHLATLVPAPNSPAPKSDLTVTIEELVALSSPEIGALAFEIENKGEDYLHIDEVLLGFGDERKTQSAAILSGQDLTDWAEGIGTRNRNRQAQAEAALLALAIIADVGMNAATAASDHRRLPGPVFTDAAVTGLVLDRQLAPPDNSLPPSHLLDGAFGVAPKLSVSRWIAIQTHDPGAGCIRFVSVRMYVRERGWLQFATRFREGKSASEWQRGRCGA